MILAVLWFAQASASQARSPRAPNRLEHRWRVQVKAPGPSDYALARISVKAPVGTHLRIGSVGPHGADYLAAGRMRHGHAAELQITILLLDRATDLMDPVDIELTLHMGRAVGRPYLEQVTDGLAARQSSPSALCHPHSGQVPLTGSAFEGLYSFGQPLPGFSAEEALAQGYDLSCGLPFQESFKRSVGEQANSTPPIPEPGPPVKEPPSCGPCQAPPGYACPLQAHSSVCVSPAPTRRIPPAAH